MFEKIILLYMSGSNPGDCITVLNYIVRKSSVLRSETRNRIFGSWKLWPNLNLHIFVVVEIWYKLTNSFGRAKAAIGISHWFWGYKINLQGRVSRLSSVCLVRTSLLLHTPGQVGILQIDKKKEKKTEVGRKKRQNTDLIQPEKHHRKRKRLATSLALCL